MFLVPQLSTNFRISPFRNTWI